MSAPTIGASELATCLGLSRGGEYHLSELELWCRLRLLMPRYEQDDDAAASLGRDLEPGTLIRYSRQLGVQVLPGPQVPAPGFAHPTEPWLSVRPDGLANGWTVEAKAPRELGPDWGPDGSDQVPTHYAVQVVAQIAVAYARAGWTHGDLAARAWFGSRTWAVYRIHRDPAVEEWALQGGRDWYRRHVEDGVPPTPDGSASAGRALARIWRPEDELAREASPEDVEDLWRLTQTKTALAELQARHDEIRQRIQARMGPSTVLRSPSGETLATWRATEGAERIDTAALRRDHPLLAKTYIKPPQPGRHWSIR